LEEKYAGIIKAPDYWWFTQSRAIYKAWDLPDGEVRSKILAVAVEAGLLHNLGPSSMTSAEAYAAATRLLGEEQDIGTLKPVTDSGRDFVNGTGEFAPDE
jgi:hypothetical protein